MHEHQPKKPVLVPWRVPVAVEDVAEGGEHFTLSADAETRAAVAKVAGLRDLARLAASFDVSRYGVGGLRVAGEVSATVGQACIVTLEPLVNEVAEQVNLQFLPRAVAAPGGGEGAKAEANDDEAEPLIGGSIDLGAIATEFLILGLDPYPRKPGALFQPPPDAAVEESPFAALAALQKGRDGH